MWYEKVSQKVSQKASWMVSRSWESAIREGFSWCFPELGISDISCQLKHENPDNINIISSSPWCSHHRDSPCFLCSWTGSVHLSGAPSHVGFTPIIVCGITTNLHCQRPRTTSGTCIFLFCTIAAKRNIARALAPSILWFVLCGYNYLNRHHHRHSVT